MAPLLRKLAFFTLSMFCLAALASSLMGPRGIPLVIAKYREMQDLDREIHGLREKVHETCIKVDKLKNSEEERKRAVRQHMNKALPGETVILLPEGQQQAPAQPEAAAGAR